MGVSSVNLKLKKMFFKFKKNIKDASLHDYYAEMGGNRMSTWMIYVCMNKTRGHESKMHLKKKNLNEK